VKKNKEELFHYLAIITIIIIITIEKVHGRRIDTIDLDPCGHNEADARLILHAADATKRAFNNAMVCTVDTAVVVMAVAAFYRIELSVLNISRGIGLEKSQALLAFHWMRSNICCTPWQAHLGSLGGFR